MTLQCMNMVFIVADKAMYLLGPVLITVAVGIIIGLTYLYVTILLPMLAGTNWIYTTSDANIYWSSSSTASSTSLLSTILHWAGYSYSTATSITTTSITTTANLEDLANNGFPFVSPVAAVAAMPISSPSSTLMALSTPSGVLHTCIVTFFLINIIYNYYQCVMTSNSGPKYDALVREMACNNITTGSSGSSSGSGSGFTYPETEEELFIYRRNFERKMYDIMMQQQQQQQQRRNSQIMRTTVGGNKEAPNNQSTPLMTSTTTACIVTTAPPPPPPPHTVPTIAPPTPPTQFLWQLLSSPNEWGYCRYSHQPKPPRSHYDHVTKTLVLNMDHYCPWMFNCVGYFNYRYFFNFLTHVTLALWYGAVVSYTAFSYIGSGEYKKQVRRAAATTTSSSGGGSSIVKHVQSNSYIPTPKECTPITLGFMLCSCLGLAVSCLFVFHLYLILSAQSTIEFHGNWSKRRKRGWTNPYSTGSRKKNWDMIYGTTAPRSCNSSSTSSISSSRYCCCRHYHYCRNVFIAMLPSNREPEYLPFPINGELIRRRRQRDFMRSNNDNTLLLLADDGDNNINDDEVMDTDLENGCAISQG